MIRLEGGALAYPEIQSRKAVPRRRRAKRNDDEAVNGHRFLGVVWKSDSRSTEREFSI